MVKRQTERNVPSKAPRPSRIARRIQEIEHPRQKHASNAETTARRQAEKRGLRSETWAVWWLRLHGWRILARRVKLPIGEVDVIARRGGVLAFVEVKWRGTIFERDYASDTRRLRRVARTAEVLAQRYARTGEAIRIDVLLFAPRAWPRHVTNVWQF